MAPARSWSGTILQLTSADAFGGGGPVNVGTTGAVTIQPSSADRSIQLGGTAGSDELDISDSELDAITAGSITVGGPTAGEIFVGELIDAANTNALVLRGRGGFQENTGGTLAETALGFVDEGATGRTWSIDGARVDMHCLVIVGSTSTRVVAGRMVTPRGYRWQC